MSSDANKIAPAPEWDAVNAFDQENNVEPFITIAMRIVERYRVHLGANALVDDISHALEDAYNLGERRGPLIPRQEQSDA